MLTVLERGKAGEVYNIGGNNERTNLELTHAILALMGKDHDSIQPVKDRLGHDLRYAIDATKIATNSAGSPRALRGRVALEQTVKWFVDNQPWWQRVKSGAYRIITTSSMPSGEITRAIHSNKSCDSLSSGCLRSFSDKIA